MTSLAARILIPLGIIGAVIAALLIQNGRLNAATARAELAEARRDSAQELADQQARAVDVLATKLLDDRATGQRLATLNNNLAAALRRGDQKIERLIHENAEYRRWAAEQLPADVVRMRERPELASGQAYLDWLSARDAVPPAGDGAAPEQRPDP